MVHKRPAAALACALLLALASCTSAATINVGWSFSPTVNGKPTKGKPVTACVGDTLMFSWRGQTHSLYTTNNSCKQGTMIAGAASSKTVPVKLGKAGTTFYGCMVPGHCAGGMKLQVIVKPCAGRRLK